jgi:c-di-GMP-related signal transduction protein
MARQPIFNIKQNVCAHGIIYRASKNNEFPVLLGDGVSFRVIMDFLNSFGLDNLTEGKPAFINFTETLILEELATSFPKKLVVIEILENVRLQPVIIKKCRGLK